MKLKSPFLNKLGGLLGSAAVRRWMSTLDYKVAYYDRTIDPVFPECRGQKIYIFWHEYILFPLYLRGHCNMAMLLSRHRDAEILSHAAYHLGFEFVRGSTNRGGVAAIRELLARSRTDAPDDHARRPARSAAASGPRLRLLGLETRTAAGGDGLRLRSSLAGAKRLGPVRHSRVLTRAPGPSPAAKSSSRRISTATGSNISARRSSTC